MDKEYIPRDEALKAIYTSTAPALEVKYIPAADVVKVIRCRDCKHYNAGFECLIEGYGIERPADYFCADGERKDGGREPPKEEA